MTDTIVSAYVGERPPKEAFRSALAHVGVKRRRSNFSQLAAAAGTVLLGETPRSFGAQERLDRDGLSLGPRPVQHWGSYQPQHLFTLNWGDGVWGPLLCDYFAIKAGSHVVVVLSAPTTDLVGYFDVALGHCSEDVAFLDGVRAILTEHWQMMRGFEMERPVGVLHEGRVTATLAMSWADAVWSDEEAE